MLKRLLEYQFKKDPKTYFLFFPMVDVLDVLPIPAGNAQKKNREETQRKSLKDLTKKFLGHEDKFIYVKPTITQPVTAMFLLYKKEFLKIITGLVKKCGARERVNVISFGTHRDVCYAKIAPEAKRAIAQAFKGREIRVYHYRPLIDPKPENPIPRIIIPANRRNRNERKEQQKPKVRRRK